MLSAVLALAAPQAEDPWAIVALNYPGEIDTRPTGGVHWLPKEKVAICACDKCGTTAIYASLYQALVKPKDLHQWSGFQSVHDPHWQGKFASSKPKDFFVSGKYFNESGSHDGYAIAFVREPVSRLISAWKDKLSCGLYLTDQSNGVYVPAADEYTRKQHGGELLRLEGRGHTAHRVTDNKCPSPKMGKNQTFTGTCAYEHCISLYDYVIALRNIHRDGNQRLLNGHFMPQDLFCFGGGATPDKWDKVTTGYDAVALKELGQHLGEPDFASTLLEGVGGSVSHGGHSTAHVALFGHDFKVAEEVIAILEEVTREEKRMLHSYYEHTDAKLNGQKFEEFLRAEVSWEPEPLGQ